MDDHAWQMQEVKEVMAADDFSSYLVVLMAHQVSLMLMHFSDMLKDMMNTLGLHPQAIGQLGMNLSHEDVTGGLQLLLGDFIL